MFSGVTDMDYDATLSRGMNFRGILRQARLLRIVFSASTSPVPKRIHPPREDDDLVAYLVMPINEILPRNKRL